MLCSPCVFSPQGAELMVLGGATETLKKATFVQLEVSVIQTTRGQHVGMNLMHFFANMGFIFMTLVIITGMRAHFTRGQLDSSMCCTLSQPRRTCQRGLWTIMLSSVAVDRMVKSAIRFQRP